MAAEDILLLHSTSGSSCYIPWHSGYGQSAQGVYQSRWPRDFLCAAKLWPSSQMVMATEISGCCCHALCRAVRQQTQNSPVKTLILQQRTISSKYKHGI